MKTQQIGSYKQKYKTQKKENRWKSILEKLWIMAPWWSMKEMELEMIPNETEWKKQSDDVNLLCVCMCVCVKRKIGIFKKFIFFVCCKVLSTPTNNWCYRSCEWVFRKNWWCCFKLYCDFCNNWTVTWLGCWYCETFSCNFEVSFLTVFLFLLSCCSMLKEISCLFWTVLSFFFLWFLVFDY